MKNTKTKAYQKGLDFAERGEYEQALELVSEHLKEYPRDIEAVNDKGAILYCMGRTDEAIGLFLQAREIDDACPQVYWNLAEAYLSDVKPGKASSLFKKMENLNILNCDLLNRAAKQFIDNGDCEPAKEMLEWSLEMAPDQEILKPMLQVIESKQDQV